MNRRRRIPAAASALVLLAALAALLAGCATTGPHGERSLILIDTPTEVRMGLETDKGIRQEYPVVQDAALSAYVQGVGAQVAAHSERKDVDYTFTVLQSDVVNAFAAPGGFIYVTTGLLAMADDEAELACVLSHEVGHVVGRHSVRQMQSAMGLQMAAQLVLGDAAGEQLWSQVAGMGGGLFMMKNSRDHEFQADQFGVKHAYMAGYDPAAMLDFFGKLAQMHGVGPTGFAGWLSTHPNTDDRIARARAELAAYDMNDHPRRRERQAFRAATAGLRAAD